MNVDEIAELAYRSLQSGEHQAALSACDQAIALANERPKLQARIHAWRAQALSGLHRYKEAQGAALRGLSMARRCGDTQGVEPLRAIHRDIAARLAVLEKPVHSEQTPLTYALAAFDRSDLSSGIQYALEALSEAEASGLSRDLVLAYLALARAPNEAPTAILSAYHIAQESGDMNLISAVARAATSAQISLPVHVF